MTQRTKQILHVRFDGRSEEVSLNELHLTRQASDAQIKAAITRHFDLPPIISMGILLYVAAALL